MISIVFADLQAKALGIPIGVGSSGTLEKIWHNFRAVGLADAFEVDHVVSATEVRAGKPAPDVYCKPFRIALPNILSCMTASCQVLTSFLLGCENSKGVVSIVEVLMQLFTTSIAPRSPDTS